jgi:hypothetical protein
MDDELFFNFLDFRKASQSKKVLKNKKNSLQTQKQHKIKTLFFEEMLGFITNRLLNALNVTYAPYASCKALMSVTPDDDIKW